MSAHRPLRVCFVVLHYAQDAAELDPERYLALTPIHRALPQALAARGHVVHLIHLFPRDAELVKDGVGFHFVASGAPARAVSRVAGRALGRDPALYESAVSAIRRVRSLRPDVVHFHGATLNLNLHLLLRALGRSGPPVILHYHGGYPSRRWIVRRLQRNNFARAARYCFTTWHHALPFVDAGVIAHPERVVELIETSSTFRRRDTAAAQRETGMTGDPVFVWVGRLHPVKDPLTALRGFRRVLATWPEAQLYMHYRSAECLPEVANLVAASPELAGHVHLSGPAPFDRMEAIYSSADFLLQASRREFSGCAVLEAMACGTIPVVTDIPSFRAMTDGGRFGILFPPGDDEALARRVLAQCREGIPRRAAEVQEYFRRTLSFEQMAAQVESLYRLVLAP